MPFFAELKVMKIQCHSDGLVQHTGWLKVLAESEFAFHWCHVKNGYPLRTDALSGEPILF